jgi:hypothetical protein
LLKASLKYLKDSFIFKQKFKKIFQKKFLFILLHLSFVQLLVLFTKCFDFFILNNYDIFAIKNEFGANGKEVSLQEYEWAVFNNIKILI